MCEESEEFGLESAENRRDCIKVAQILSGDFQGSDKQTSSLSKSESQTTKATGEISTSCDRNKQPKSPYQSHTKPKDMFEVNGPRQTKLL